MKLRGPLLLLAVCMTGAALGGTACNGGSAPTPSPGVSPTPTFVPQDCQIVWYGPATGTTAGFVVDAYLLDLPIGDWSVGTHGYVTGPGPRGIFYRGFNLANGDFAKRAIATSGSFSLAAVSTTNGGPVTFSALAPQPYQLLSSTGGLLSESEGTSGTGSFSGPLSDPLATEVTPGSGTIQVLFEGTSHLLGLNSAGSLTYSICSATAQSPTPIKGR